MSDGNKKKINKKKTSDLNRGSLNVGDNDDIKRYDPKRSTKESRVRAIRNSNYKSNDEDFRTYRPKRSIESNIEDENIVSGQKKSNIRIKKQQSSGSGSRNLSTEKNRNRKKSNVVSFSRNADIDEEYLNEDSRKKKIKLSILKKKRFRRIMKRVIAVFLILFVIMGSAGFLYVRSVTSEMPVLTKRMVYESYINKDPVALSQIPKTLQKAVIAVEDRRFYKHGGIDVRSLIRSFVNNARGKMLQGGSTIDMQLSKNILTNNQRTLKRKVQDMYNAVMLNKIMTKDEILEAYLNNIYMGKSAYGVNAGAHLYFGKDVSKLNFGECTMLAGILNNPGFYQDYEQAKKRQAMILYRMYKQGYIKEYVYKAQLYRDTPFKSEIDK